MSKPKDLWAGAFGPLRILYVLVAIIVLVWLAVRLG